MYLSPLQQAEVLCFFLAVKAYPGVEIAEESDWGQFIQGSTAVINLAGTPISTRWSSDVHTSLFLPDLLNFQLSPDFTM